MDNFINNFIQYEGVSPKLPTEVSCFKYLSHPFFIEIPSANASIYTLNKVSVRVSHFQIEQNIQTFEVSKIPSGSHTLTLPISVKVEINLHYTICDLMHSIYSIPYQFSLFDTLTYFSSNKPLSYLKPSLYVEDIFAYCPDPTHIYGHVLLLINLPN